MAIIDFNTTPDRGTPTTVTLNKTELASLPSVANDSYFSDSSNWKKVVMVFKNDGENVQKETVYFDATQTTPTSKFDISPKSQGNFLIESILIQDFDGGYFQVVRDELNTADFDVNLNVVPSPEISYDAALFESNFSSTMAGGCPVHDISKYSDGSLLVVGDSGGFFPGFSYTSNIGKVDSSGNYDASFNGDGQDDLNITNVIRNRDATAIDSNDNSYLIVDTGSSTTSIKKLDSNANEITSFEQNFQNVLTSKNINDLSFYYIRIENDSIFAVGSNAFSVVKILKLNLDGSLDVSFDTNLENDLNANSYIVTGFNGVRERSDGKYILVGELTDSRQRDHIIVLNSDGTIDDTLTDAFALNDTLDGPAFDQAILDLELLDDGSVIFVGNFDTGSKLKIVKFDSNGDIVSEFNTLTSGLLSYPVTQIEIRSDGKINLVFDQAPDIRHVVTDSDATLILTSQLYSSSNISDILSAGGVTFLAEGTDFRVIPDVEPPAYTRDFSDPAARTAIESFFFDDSAGSTFASTYIDSAGYLSLFVDPRATFSSASASFSVNTSTLGLTEERYYKMEIDYSTVFTAYGANLEVYLGSYSASVNINTLNQSGGTVTLNNLYKSDFDPDSLSIRLHVQGNGTADGTEEIFITEFRIIPV